MNLGFYGATSDLWKIYDNAFDTCTFILSSHSVTNGNNAYINCANRLNPTNVSDVVLTNFTYQAGPLGNYYQPTNSALINAGSVTNAGLVGLYHYTTTTNQVKETNSVVDIGYHYVAVDGNGNAVDSNADGTPDYQEDSNGNGAQDEGETLWGISISTQPGDQTVFVGDDVIFSVSAAGLAPLSYQWHFNGANIGGATNATLTVDIVQTNNAGDYSVVITNLSGSITSSIAMLTVQIPVYTVLSGSLTNYTFQSDTTYYIAAPVSLYGTSVLEGGTVLKYGNGTNTQLNVYGLLKCETSPYRPAVLTAKDDNSVGATISGSTGNPQTGGYYGNAAIAYQYSGTPLNAHDLRICYKSSGISIGVSATHEVKHCEFYKVGRAISGSGVSISINARNILIHNAAVAAFSGSNTTVNAEHITAHEVVSLVSFSGSSALQLTNSLLVQVTNWGDAFTGVSNATNSTGSGVFQAVGCGFHYLDTNSIYRHAGTTNINASLLADLKRKTTYPPVVLTGMDITNDLVLSPQISRGNDTPDLGYYYDPIDYALAAC
jgi:hypothetical protein